MISGSFAAWPLRPRCKGLAQTSFHLRRIEVADDAENDVVRVNILAVPVDQILARDGRHGRIFRDSRIRTVCAVGQLRRFPSRNLPGIVIAPRDAVVQPLLRNFNFVGAKLRILQHIHERAKDVVEIFFQTRKRYIRVVDPAAGFDLGGALLQKVVQLIAGLGLSPASAPHFAVDIGQPRLVCRNRALAAANASGAANDR